MIKVFWQRVAVPAGALATLALGVGAGVKF